MLEATLPDGRAHRGVGGSWPREDSGGFLRLSGGAASGGLLGMMRKAKLIPGQVWWLLGEPRGARGQEKAGQQATSRGPAQRTHVRSTPQLF